MTLEMHVVDAFVDGPFSGNPAAVVLVGQDDLDAAWMQQVAMQNNLSETAFVRRQPDGRYSIRWFSPSTEIDFCGHATLASAHVLFASGAVSKSVVFTAAAVGEVEVHCTGEACYEMRFPVRAPAPVEAVPPALRQGLSIEPVAVLRNVQAYFAVYNTEQEVRAVVPNLEALAQLAPFDVVVTAPGVTQDFVSRYFWPAHGGAEDPVTGSIHAGLAPYWAGRLGKHQLSAYQASARGGWLACRVTDDAVFVSGRARTFLTGHIHAIGYTGQP